MRFWKTSNDVARWALFSCALLLCSIILQPWPVSADVITVTFDFDNSDHSWTNCGTPGTCQGNDWAVGNPSTTPCGTTPSGSTNAYATTLAGNASEPACSWIESPTIGFGADALLKLDACWDMEYATDAAQVRVSCLQTTTLDPASALFNNYTMIDPMVLNDNWYNTNISQNMGNSAACPTFVSPSDHGFTGTSPCGGGDCYESSTATRFELNDSTLGGGRFTFSNDFTKCRFRIYFGSKVSGVTTPGFYLDNAIVEMQGQTAVVLIYFEATGLDSEVFLDWETATEKDTIGFNVYRSLDEWGPFDEQVNENIILAVGGLHHGASYSITDTDVVNGVTYFYKLEEVDYQGNAHYWGPVAATPDSDSPLPLAPDDNAIVSALVPPAFEWNGLDFAMFKVQYSADPDFPVENRISIPAHDSWSPDTFLTPDEGQWESIVAMIQDAGTAAGYWRVVGKDSLDDLAFSDTLSFTLSYEESRSEGAEGGLSSLLKNLFLLITGRPL